MTITKNLSALGASVINYLVRILLAVFSAVFIVFIVEVSSKMFMIEPTFFYFIMFFVVFQDHITNLWKN